VRCNAAMVEAGGNADVRKKQRDLPTIEKRQNPRKPLELFSAGHRGAQENIKTWTYAREKRGVLKSSQYGDPARFKASFKMESSEKSEAGFERKR